MFSFPHVGFTWVSEEGMREALNGISCKKLVCNWKASAYGFPCLFSSSLSIANQLIIKTNKCVFLKHTCVLNPLKTFLNSKNNFLPSLKVEGRIRPLNTSFLSIKKKSLQVDSVIKCYPEAPKAGSSPVPVIHVSILKAFLFSVSWIQRDNAQSFGWVSAGSTWWEVSCNLYYIKNH